MQKEKIPIVSNYKLRSVKTKSFKGNRLKKIAFALKGYFPHNYIESQRVIIRHPKRRDWKAWVNLRRESYGFLQKWEPYWSLNQCNKSNYMRQLKLQRTKAAYDQAYSFLCFEKHNKVLLGGINISNIQRGVIQTCNIGYWLGEKNTGKGYMQESIKALIPYIYEQLKIHRIQAFTLEDNIPSRKLIEKVNFKKEGVLREAMQINNEWRDHVIYSLLLDDTKNN